MHLLCGKIFSRCCKLKLQILTFLSTDTIKHMTYKAGSIVQQKREHENVKITGDIRFQFQAFHGF